MYRKIDKISKDRVYGEIISDEELLYLFCHYFILGSLSVGLYEAGIVHSAFYREAYSVSLTLASRKIEYHKYYDREEAFKYIQEYESNV